MTEPKKPDPTNADEVTLVDCKVVVRETASDLIVRTSAGGLVNIESRSLEVREGSQGILLTVGEKTIFLREPYDGG